MKQVEYEYKDHKYWVTVEPGIVKDTNSTFYIAYVSDEKPGALLLGRLAKHPDGTVILFSSPLHALQNAQAIKQSEIDSKK